jgi:hypothetical protein
VPVLVVKACSKTVRFTPAETVEAACREAAKLTVWFTEEVAVEVTETLEAKLIVLVNAAEAVA